MKYKYQFLKSLETNNTPESHYMDFSCGLVDPRRKDPFVNSLCKGISGFSNADSGKIILGVKPKKQGKMEIIDKIDNGIDPDILGKEDLEQILLSNISPKIDINIHVIKKSSSKNWYAVIEVPKAYTAVQSLIDYRYYRRRNFKTEPMTNDEILDVMGRAKYPELDLDFSTAIYCSHPILIIHIVNKGEVISSDFGFNIFYSQDEAAVAWRLPNQEQILDLRGNKGVFKYRSYLDPNKPILFPGDNYLVTTTSVCEFKLKDKEVKVSYEVFSENPIRKMKKRSFSLRGKG